MKGITVTLWERTKIGVDELNNPVYAETPVEIEDVLVGQPSTDDVTSTLSLYGKKLDYVLGIPKGDAHNWRDSKIEFFGKIFRSFGEVVEGIEANIPGRWHKQVRVQHHG